MQCTCHSHACSFVIVESFMMVQFYGLLLSITVMAGGYLTDAVYHSHCLLGLSAAGVTRRLNLMVIYHTCFGSIFLWASPPLLFLLHDVQCIVDRVSRSQALQTQSALPPYTSSSLYNLHLACSSAATEVTLLWLKQPNVFCSVYNTMQHSTSVNYTLWCVHRCKDSLNMVVIAVVSVCPFGSMAVWGKHLETTLFVYKPCTTLK